MVSGQTSKKMLAGAYVSKAVGADPNLGKDAFSGFALNARSDYVKENR